MMKKTTGYLLLLLLLFSSCSQFIFSLKKYKKEKESGAGIALDMWSISRAFPESTINNAQFVKAFEQQHRALQTRDALNLPKWESLGPKNIGGRTLALAFHPTNPNILFAGSASGGLWKTTTAGVGANAWQRVDVGFPVLGVSSIAIAHDGNTIYVGTGEVYGYRNVGDGYAIRYMRGSYGIGILKSTDGGVTWSKSLDWSYSSLKGIQDIIINPKNTNTVYAATTEGVYKSQNAGATWTQISNRIMAVDIDMHPTDTNKLFVTYGSLYNYDVGIYRTNNGGVTWTHLTNGLPLEYSGKAMIDISPTNPNLMVASIANAQRQIGLYKSLNGGDNWFRLNNNDVASYQGWFSHDAAFLPKNPNHIFHVGVDAYCSVDGGTTFGQISYWHKWAFGRTPAGGPEGPEDYVHADIHGIAFSPHNSAQVWLYTDGGIFMSADTGKTWQGRNGGYQTQQFYANFSNSHQDSVFAIGGMQDNATAIYDGNRASWIRIIGGDGMCTAINPRNDSILYCSTQYLGMLRSFNRARSFNGVMISNESGVNTFNAPFEIAPSNPDTLYAGAQRLMYSVNAGRSFVATSQGMIDGGNQILTIAIAPDNAAHVYCSTAPYETNSVKVFKTTDGGKTFQAMTGLPNRITTDIVFHPKNAQIVHAVVSGFGTAHLYRTINGGRTWLPFGTGLPDVPAHSMVFDPENPEFVYFANDLGVYYSRDTGNTWQPFNDGLPSACLGMHLSISPKNKKLRLATHGLGVYECDLLEHSDFYTKIDFVKVTNRMETKTESVPAVYALKVHPSDVIIIEKNGSTPLQLDFPANLAPPDVSPPQYPYPFGTSSVLNNSQYPYKLTATRTDGNPSAGVTTFDIALISRHLLDKEKITSRYRLLAADVDATGEIDAADMILIRRVILKYDPLFKNVPNWIFVPKSFDMPAEPKLSDIPTAYYINPYSPNNPSVFEFINIKTGDVNESAVGLKGQKKIEDRQDSYVLSIDNQLLEQGKTYNISIKAAQAGALLGMQSTLSTEGVEILDFIGALPDFTDDNINMEDKNQGKIAFSWNRSVDLFLKNNQPVFTLKIKALKTQEIKNALQLNNDIIINEAFNESDVISGQPRTLTLKYTTDHTMDKLYPAEPNPFNTVTYIKFDVSTEGGVIFNLFDETGRQIFQKRGYYGKGQNILKLEKEFNALANGMYILTLQKGERVLNMKIQKMK